MEKIYFEVTGLTGTGGDFVTRLATLQFKMTCTYNKVTELGRSSFALYVYPAKRKRRLVRGYKTLQGLTYRRKRCEKSKIVASKVIQILIDFFIGTERLINSQSAFT